MDRRLLRVSRALPLPAGWSAPELFVDTVALEGARGRVEVRRAGLQARGPDGTEVTGSAAELDGDPLPRAWYELLERVAIVEATGAPRPRVDAGGHPTGAFHVSAPDRERPRGEGARRAARSNGVALHRSFEAARDAARRELVERDLVLGSWYGELPLRRGVCPARLGPFTGHDWQVRLVRDPDGVAPDLVAAVVVGFPRRSTAPLARGFAAAPDAHAAADAAAREALQNLAFLWDEPVPVAAPTPSPTPFFHLDYYLVPAHHEALRAWLDRDAASSRPRPRTEPRAGRRPGRTAGAVSYVDLTPACLSGAARVVRAVATSTRPLVFGPAAPPVAPTFCVHPIA